MKIKYMSILLACIILLAAPSCSLQNGSSSDDDSATEQVSTTLSSEDAIEATSKKNDKETSSGESSTAGNNGPTIETQNGGESRSGNTSSHKPSGQTGSLSADDFTSLTSKPSGGGSTGGSSPGGGTSSKLAPSLAQASSSNPTSTSSQPNSSPSSSKPDQASAVPDYLKPYVYPFNVAAIKADLIAYGEGLGMTHITHHPDGTIRTPDNCSWWNPYPLTSNCKDPAQTRRQLQERVKFDMDDLGLVNFTIYIEAGPNGQYNVYMMH